MINCKKFKNYKNKMIKVKKNFINYKFNLNNNLQN